MREEAERIVREEGWTKAALNSMVKIDSFLPESQRINTNGPGTFISEFSVSTLTGREQRECGGE
jgi:hypothetical protein